MKNISLIALLVASMTLAACGKKAPTAEATKTDAPAASTSAASAPKSDEKPRLATYDPNLKPAQIVWDSPEKKKAWEARQAQLQQAQKSGAAQAPVAAPAASGKH